MTSKPSVDGRAVAPGQPAPTTARPPWTVAGRAALVVAAGALFGWLGVTTHPEEHVVRAMMQIATVDDEASALRATATQRALITSIAVLGPVAERTFTPLEELDRAVEVYTDPEESSLRVDVTAATAERAQEITADIVTEYLTVAYAGDVPADGLARVRLVLPPHVVEGQATTAIEGSAIGAMIGLGVAIAAAAAAPVTARNSR